MATGQWYFLPADIQLNGGGGCGAARPGRRGARGDAAMRVVDAAKARSSSAARSHVTLTLDWVSTQRRSTVPHRLRRWTDGAALSSAWRSGSECGSRSAPTASAGRRRARRVRVDDLLLAERSARGSGRVAACLLSHGRRRCGRRADSASPCASNSTPSVRRRP